eukprot:1599403-Pyramimonas_sp.AAC.1
MESEPTSDHAAMQQWSKAIEEASLCMSGHASIEDWRAAVAAKLASVSAENMNARIFRDISDANDLNLSEQNDLTDETMDALNRIRGSIPEPAQAMKWKDDQRPIVEARVGGVFDFITQQICSRSDLDNEFFAISMDLSVKMGAVEGSDMAKEEAKMLGVYLTARRSWISLWSDGN